ncbi:hypothetical protein BGZ99_007556 [Dissophora globulifera]|uniref:Uncharacterized protein n=1 Tax=Dissophora globulifera TaxID=979702 RepID=A0A9P6RSJ2_9FUNG|nr:hypothetical protein BGZ99_007556 [Dissophora globulifera]
MAMRPTRSTSNPYASRQHPSDTTLAASEGSFTTADPGPAGALESVAPAVDATAAQSSDVNMGEAVSTSAPLQPAQVQTATTEGEVERERLRRARGNELSRLLESQPLGTPSISISSAQSAATQASIAFMTGTTATTATIATAATTSAPTITTTTKRKRATARSKAATDSSTAPKRTRAIQPKPATVAAVAKPKRVRKPAAPKTPATRSTGASRARAKASQPGPSTPIVAARRTQQYFNIAPHPSRVTSSPGAIAVTAGATISYPTPPSRTPGTMINSPAVTYSSSRIPSPRPPISMAQTRSHSPGEYDAAHVLNEMPRYDIHGRQLPRYDPVHVARMQPEAPYSATTAASADVAPYPHDGQLGYAYGYPYPNPNNHYVTRDDYRNTGPAAPQTYTDQDYHRLNAYRSFTEQYEDMIDSLASQYETLEYVEGNELLNYSQQVYERGYLDAIDDSLGTHYRGYNQHFYQQQPIADTTRHQQHLRQLQLQVPSYFQQQHQQQHQHQQQQQHQHPQQPNHHHHYQESIYQQESIHPLARPQYSQDQQRQTLAPMQSTTPRPASGWHLPPIMESVRHPVEADTRSWQTLPMIRNPRYAYPMDPEAADVDGDDDDDEDDDETESEAGGDAVLETEMETSTVRPQSMMFGAAARSHQSFLVHANENEEEMKTREVRDEQESRAGQQAS